MALDFSSMASNTIYYKSGVKIHRPPHPGAPYSPKQSQILKIENAGKVR
jgi:hypothetical protein